jgi:hypothetical protein
VLESPLNNIQHINTSMYGTCMLTITLSSVLFQARDHAYQVAFFPLRVIQAVLERFQLGR